MHEEDATDQQRLSIIRELLDEEEKSKAAVAAVAADAVAKRRKAKDLRAKASKSRKPASLSDDDDTASHKHKEPLVSTHDVAHGSDTRNAASATLQQSQDDEDDRLCVVCLAHSRSVLLVPCGHFVLCQLCHAGIRDGNNECPMCRGNIESTLTPAT